MVGKLFFFFFILLDINRGTLFGIKIDEGVGCFSYVSVILNSEKIKRRNSTLNSQSLNSEELIIPSECASFLASRFRVVEIKKFFSRYKNL